MNPSQTPKQNNTRLWIGLGLLPAVFIVLFYVLFGSQIDPSGLSGIFIIPFFFPALGCLFILPLGIYQYVVNRRQEKRPELSPMTPVLPRKSDYYASLILLWIVILIDIGIVGYVVYWLFQGPTGIFGLPNLLFAVVISAILGPIAIKGIRKSK